MNNDPLFDVNKDNKTITVKHGFEANRDLVWKAWTTSELLDKWWAPKPYKVVTKSMNFTEGGRWLYSMNGPEGEQHWSLFDYKKIVPKESFSGTDAFCDENGNIDTDKPQGSWENTFSGYDERTTVSVQLRFNNLKDMEELLEMGFKEGFTMGLNNLDALLKTLEEKAEANR